VTAGPWDIYETVSTWGAPSRYTASTGGQRYRWITDNPHSSRASTNYCWNYDVYYANDFAAHFTDYKTLGPPWENGLCIVLRARSLYGTQYNRYGNLIY
jgi:hypothetical protein